MRQKPHGHRKSKSDFFQVISLQTKQLLWSFEGRSTSRGQPCNHNESCMDRQFLLVGSSVSSGVSPWSFMELTASVPVVLRAWSPSLYGARQVVFIAIWKVGLAWFGAHSMCYLGSTPRWTLLFLIREKNGGIPLAGGTREPTSVEQLQIYVDLKKEEGKLINPWGKKESLF